MKKKIIVGLSAVALLSGVAIWAAKPEHIRVPVFMLWQPPEMAAAQYSNEDVVGDLGGVPVTIPKHFAEYVEYDGDPGFGEKREGPVPVRTHESKLRSFGFDVRYPDMTGLSSPELREDKRKENIYKTMWINVGITTGEHYSGNGFLDRFTNSTLNPKSEVIEYEDYERLSDLQFGLEVYSPKGIDVKTGIPYKNHRNARDMYVSRDESGKVQSVILCSNRPVQSVLCDHSISLEPNIKTEVHISYRRQLLPEWKKIQGSVVKVIESFQVNK